MTGSQGHAYKNRFSLVALMVSMKQFIYRKCALIKLDFIENLPSYTQK